jgi:hypothetical protein
MALSLHAEYLLGYLAGAKRIAIREVVPLALVGAADSTQSKALLKALSLGMADGRRDRSLREPHEVRMHVLALLTRESGPTRLSRVSGTSEPPSDIATDEGLNDEQIESFIAQASQIG